MLNIIKDNRGNIIKDPTEKLVIQMLMAQCTKFQTTEKQLLQYVACNI